MTLLQVAAAGGAIVLTAVAVSVGPSRDASQDAPGPPVAAAPAAAPGHEEHVEVPAPPFSDGIFPCTDCHEQLPVDRTRRPLEMHADILLRHDEEHRWCLDCHDADNRDVLHLASGEPVPFDESYRLCGQCHGEKYRDWRVGVHGRRTGQWNGRKGYLLCVHCHNPHAPRFPALEPMPPPRRPARPVR